jgi:hypothetical protein
MRDSVLQILTEAGKKNIKLEDMQHLSIPFGGKRLNSVMATVYKYALASAASARPVVTRR